jgi:hypothetical protein
MSKTGGLRPEGPRPILESSIPREGCPTLAVLARVGTTDLHFSGFIEVGAAHPFAQDAKGWGTLIGNSASKKQGRRLRHPPLPLILLWHRHARGCPILAFLARVGTTGPYLYGFRN